MILRRIIAVVLGVILIFVTWFSLISLRVNDTVLSDGFYAEQLREGDVYNFFYDELLPLLIDEASEEKTLGREIDLRKVKPQIITALRETFPPEFLQEETERALKVFVPYLVGSEDEFVVEVPIADRIRAAGPAFKKAIRDGAIVDLLYEDVITPAVEDLLEEPEEVPFEVPVTTEEVVDIMRRIAPADWLEGQMANAIDTIVPYFAGDVDRFIVVIDVSDRLDVARPELKALLAKWDARTFLFDEIVDPAAETSIGDDFKAPFDLTVTSQDVQTVLRETLTEEWVRLQVDTLVDVTVDYLSGDTRGLAFVVPLEDRKGPAVESVGRLIDERLAALYPTIRVCNPLEAQTLDINDFKQTGILCRPPGLSLDVLKTAVDLTDFDDEVARLVDGVLPDTFTLSEAEIRGVLGEDQWSTLQDIREAVQDGFTFTDIDLEDELARDDYPSNAFVSFADLDDAGRQRARDASNNVEALREFREDIQDVQFTQEDLKERLEEEDPEVYENLQDTRDSLDSGRGFWRIFAWLLPVLLLVSVGMLGGRSIAAKVIWAATFIAIPSIILFFSVGPGYSSGYRDTIEREITEEIEKDALVDTPAETAIKEKGRDILQNGVDDIFSGLSRRALILMIVSLVVLGGAVGYYRWEKGRGPPESSL